MNQFYTLISENVNYNVGFKSLSKFDNPFFEGNEDKWTSIKLIFNENNIVFNSLTREKPGDKFSKTILGMHNYFNRVETPLKERKRKLLQKIGNAKWLIGVVIDSSSGSDGNIFYDLIFNIATAIDAMIFTGDSIVDCHGKLLLNSIGEGE